MTDIVDAAIRSKMMSGIKAKNTLPEVLVRKGLHSRGIRFRIHADNLPGKPDLVLRKYSAVIFIHGCFWHGHACRYFKVPKTRSEFWISKIQSNQQRDQLHIDELSEAGWRVMVVWECATRLMRKGHEANLVDLIVKWLNGSGCFAQIDEHTLGGSE
ncbi:DNA mismatch endonuclease Vsr [Pseudomonas sp. RC10]|uniref:very short patch repair endonuclease n=1 Tax=Pseudomonas bambusae TaxID=3139142 RepID=UPI0031386C90